MRHSNIQFQDTIEIKNVSAIMLANVSKIVVGIMKKSAPLLVRNRSQ